jgi:hypothetical protein
MIISTHSTYLLITYGQFFWMSDCFQMFSSGHIFFFALVGGNQFSREPSSTCPSVPAGSIDASGLRISSGAGARTTSSRLAPPLGTVGFGWLSGGHSGALCERGIPYSLRTTVRQLAPAGCGRFHEASCCRPGSHTALHLHHCRH